MKRLLVFLIVLCSAVPAWSECPLRQSTASQQLSIGPFLDVTDGDTEKTGLTIANTDIRIKKGSAAWAQKNSGGATHEEKGNYRITLDATDTNTVGLLDINVHVAGALDVWRQSCFVYTAAVYDALFSSSAPGYVANAPVNVAQFGGVNGTFASGRAEMNLTHIAGSIVNAGVAQLGANVVNYGGSAGSFLAGRPSVNVNTNNDKTGYAVSTNSDKTGYGLSSAERTSTADVVLDRSGGADRSLREMMRLIAAALAGKTSGSGTSTIVFRDPADTKNVITCTVSNGNRTDCTLDTN